MKQLNYREYNRLLRNQVLLALAIEKVATVLSGRSSEGAEICRQLITEVDEFERSSPPAHTSEPTP